MEPIEPREPPEFGESPEAVEPPAAPAPSSRDAAAREATAQVVSTSSAAQLDAAPRAALQAAGPVRVGRSGPAAGRAAASALPRRTPAVRAASEWRRGTGPAAPPDSAPSAVPSAVASAPVGSWRRVAGRVAASALPRRTPAAGAASEPDGLRRAARPVDAAAEPHAVAAVHTRAGRPRRSGGRGLARGFVVAVGAALLVVLPAVPAQADGIRAQEWALDAIRAEEAWRTTKGEGATVAVLDTGVDGRHPDLEGQVLPEKDLIGFGASRGDRAWARHGTAMAGIIAGHGHGPGRADGVLGVAPEAKILPVRVILEDGDPARKKARSARAGALAEGIRWAADHGADVINLSLGDDSESAHPEPKEDAAVQYALSKGAVVVASAGNGGEDGDRISYPAAYPGVIAVTAVDRYGNRAPFSTRRWYATVCAPGVDVVIADPDRRYYEGWGTSAAAAFVSGAVALVRSAHPDLSPVQIKKLLTDTARNAPEGGRSDARGAGLVDPAAAIEAGAKLKPRPQRPAPAEYGQRYFGAGPDEARDKDGASGVLAPVAGGAGTVLLVSAVALWHRGRRESTPAQPR
jgi:type VII secretion-associated serine protease mycosin